MMCDDSCGAMSSRYCISLRVVSVCVCVCVCVQVIEEIIYENGAPKHHHHHHPEVY